MRGIKLRLQGKKGIVTINFRSCCFRSFRPLPESPPPTPPHPLLLIFSLCRRPSAAARAFVFAPLFSIPLPSNGFRNANTGGGYLDPVLMPLCCRTRLCLSPFHALPSLASRIGVGPNSFFFELHSNRASRYRTRTEPNFQPRTSNRTEPIQNQT